MITKENVEKILTNPLYIGIGGFEKVIDDEMFIRAAKIIIEKDGMQNYLSLLFQNLKEAFEMEYPKKEEVVEDAIKAYENGKIEEFLQTFIKELRNFYKEWRISPGMPDVILHFINVFLYNLYSEINCSIFAFINPTISINAGFINPPIFVSAMLFNPPILTQNVSN